MVGACGLQSIVSPSPILGPDGFDLNSPKNSSQAHDHVVAIGISPRLGNGEAQGSGSAHEGEFGKFAAMFAVELGGVLEFVL